MYTFSTYLAGSWKKLDVDISFKSKKEQSSKGDNTRNDNTNKEQGRKRADRKDRISNRANEGNSDAKKPSGRSKHSSYGEGQANGRQRSGSGQKQQGSSSHAHGAGERSGHGKKDRSSRSNRHHKNQHRNNRHHSRQQHYRQPRLPDLPPSELDALKADAVRQVEYFFSVNELSRNVWLRSHMDIEGYVPAAIIFNFPSVVAYSLPYQDLLVAVAAVSEKVEVDAKNETIRLREGYKHWLCPNAEGGLGCPRWIKEPQRDEEGEWDETTEETACDAQESLRITSEDVEEDGEKVEDDNKGTNTSNDESSNGSHDTPDTTPCSDSEAEHTDEDQSQ